MNLNVRDHIPLEQGLRPAVAATLARLAAGQRPYSIRTRIKTNNLSSDCLNPVVRDHIPLEQGLRHRW